MTSAGQTQPDETELNVSIAKEYFRRADAGRADLLDLMTQDVQLYFPKFGVARGRQAFREVAAGLGGVFDWVEHDSVRTTSSLQPATSSWKALRAAR